ncbi:hypothetical protein [Citrobacter sp. wls706]|uniref:hypothetical protein n=1 Tax=Citrobacter sp. wls706 TaxID=2576429 RepID=UPI0010CA81A1|nr:hypothetical protein [Citrobacter sp. wls706]TKU75786.1 hypothetical protein FDW92_08125 [Citrobacter sp. wls706]
MKLQHTSQLKQRLQLRQNMPPVYPWGFWFYGWSGNFKTAQENEEVTQGSSDRVLSRTTFIYDTLCRLVEAKNDDATVTYEYDDASRVAAGITAHFIRGLMGEIAQWQIADHAPLTLEHE